MKSHKPTKDETVHVEAIRHKLGHLNITEDGDHNATASFTKWSAWTRCENCYQMRMKICLEAKCRNSRIYEERPCDKKRCKRKARQKAKFNVVHLYQVRKFVYNRECLKSAIFLNWFHVCQLTTVYN